MAANQQRVSPDDQQQSARKGILFKLGDAAGCQEKRYVLQQYSICSAPILGNSCTGGLSVRWSWEGAVRNRAQLIFFLIDP